MFQPIDVALGPALEIPIALLPIDIHFLREPLEVDLVTVTAPV